ncbi:hypothetical protein Tco_0361138, partial [Tanacetum coccineum]
MDDPNMTMEEYIKFEEEKACRRGRVFNWQNATYGKIRVNDGLYVLGSVEAEFPAIVIDDTVTPQDALLCKSQVMSGYDEEEQNILYFNDKFPFNIIRPDDLKSEKEKNDNDVDIIHSSKGNEITHMTNKHMDTSCDKIDKIFNEESLILELNVDIVTWTYLFDGMLLCFIMNLYVPFGISFDPKRYYKDGNCAIMLQRLRYQGLEYTEEDITDFEERMRMEHRDDAGVVLFTSRAWGRLFDTRGPLVRELILEFLSMLRFGERIGDETFASNEGTQVLAWEESWAPKRIRVCFLEDEHGSHFWSDSLFARLGRSIGGAAGLICSKFDDTWPGWPWTNRPPKACGWVPLLSSLVATTPATGSWLAKTSTDDGQTRG